MLSIAVIVNPTAGRGEAGRRLPEVRAALNSASDIKATYYETQRPGDGTRQAIDSINEGADIVVAMGGDGTLHEVVNALRSRPDSSAILGLIPFGTGNDFARAVGLHATLKQKVETLIDGEAHEIDIGVISSPSLENPKHFLVAAGMGFVADTARTVNAGIRGLTGPTAYIYGALATLRRFKPQPLNLIIDGKTVYRGEATLISVSNVATTGGGIRIAPGSEPDDGLLNICLVDKVSKSKIALMLPKTFSGAHVSDNSVTMFTGAIVEIATENECALWIDGEVVGNTPATFTVIPNALKMMLPKDWCARQCI